jgi:predicted ATPase
MADRIAELRIAGLRTIEDLKLPLTGLTVMVGENGAGKSSIIEACRLLRSAARVEFMSAFHGVHGGMYGLLRHGARRLTVGARIESDDGEPALDYELVLEKVNDAATFAGEALRTSDGTALLERNRHEVRIGSIYDSGRPNETALAISRSIADDGTITRARRALENIEVHVPFEVLPSWAARAQNRRSVLRGSVPLQQASRLDLLADNLPNVYYALRNSREWPSALEMIRMGLGDEIEDVRNPIDPAGGAIGLALQTRGGTEVSASSLSDGQLAYLAFVGLFSLPTERSLLAFDEPELHLHPALLARVVQMFEAASSKCPVLLAAQSDSLLDCLSDPAQSVRVCELRDPMRHTQVTRLDAQALETWLRRYRGLGQIRGEGFLSQVMEGDE